MIDEIPASEESCERMVRRCERMLRSHAEGLVNQDELFYNLMVALIHPAVDATLGTRLGDCWGLCLALFPTELKRAFAEWLEREVAAVDYMPPPNAFVADTRDATAVEARRRELRPHFVALHHLVRQ